MKTGEELKNLLRQIDHKSYKAYKEVKGIYRMPGYVLAVDHVQGDPFATPSRVRLLISNKNNFPKEVFDTKWRKNAAEDDILRNLHRFLRKNRGGRSGSGKSGLVLACRAGQEVMERVAVVLSEEQIEVRLEVGFPAFGRSIAAGELEKIFFLMFPAMAKEVFCYANIDQNKLKRAVELADDQQKIREALVEKKLVAFVADGAILPRESGVSDLPLKGAVPFVSPEDLAVTLNLPHAGTVRGMGIKEGVTLIAGGGYHGKSTLLKAIQNGVYNHIAGDGREYVITDASAVKLRAEEGRCIHDEDISMFINDLPNGRDTTCFSTMDASGSTSQAAGVVESMEAGTRLLLIDEDTSATNFMVRDALMQRVISREKEPITPFIERMRVLYKQAGISTILVAGSSGAFFYEADRVIQMDRYHVVDITDKVREICGQNEKGQITSAQFEMPVFDRKNPSAGHKREQMHGGRDCGRRRGRQGSGGSERPRAMKVKVMGRETMVLDKETVDLRYVEQLADSEQTAALAYFMRYLLEKNQTVQTVQETVDGVEKIFDERGWQAFCSGYVPCGLARPRKQEIYAVLNRYRG